jgi:rRNA maturation endonuclease Nob1
LGIDFNVIPGKIYSVPGVLEEIKVKRYQDKNRNILNRISYARDTRQLILRVPTNSYVKEVEKKAKVTNDLRVLSDVDIKLIALALELKKTTKKKIILYTNDYSMENLCSELNITFSPLRRKGIKKRTLFEWYCPFCNIIKQDNQPFCETCGSKLKRRPKKQ